MACTQTFFPSRRWCRLAAVCLLLAACTSHPVSAPPGTDYRIELDRSGNWQIAGHSSVYLAYPVAVPNNQSSFPRTRAHLSRELLGRAGRSFQVATLADADESWESSLSRAQLGQYDFLLALSVQDMDAAEGFVSRAQRTHTTSGEVAPVAQIEPRRLLLSLQVFEVNSGRLLDTLQLEAKHSWYRPRLGSDTPTLTQTSVEALLHALGG